MREDGRFLGLPSHLPVVRRDALLRQLGEPACHATCAGHRPPRRRIGGAGRAVALLLSGSAHGSLLTPRPVARVTARAALTRPRSASRCHSNAPRTSPTLGADLLLQLKIGERRR